MDWTKKVNTKQGKYIFIKNGLNTPANLRNDIWFA